MSNTYNNLKLLRKKLNLNQTDFGANLGWTIGVVKNLEAGITTLNELQVNLICKIYNVNKNWLVDGIGDMFANKENTDLNSFQEKYNLSISESQFLQNYLNLSQKERENLVITLSKLTDSTQNTPTILAVSSRNSSDEIE